MSTKWGPFLLTWKDKSSNNILVIAGLLWSAAYRHHVNLLADLTVLYSLTESLVVNVVCMYLRNWKTLIGDSFVYICVMSRRTHTTSPWLGNCNKYFKKTWSGAYENAMSCCYLSKKLFTHANISGNILSQLFRMSAGDSSCLKGRRTLANTSESRHWLLAINMRLKGNVAFVLVICLSYQVILSDTEVVLVTRNVIDSFRVGKGSCVTDSVCNDGAKCNTADGLCYCEKGTPNFRNPGIYSRSGKYVYSDSYGCMSNANIIQRVGQVPVCRFLPFQLLPFSSNEEEVVVPYEISGTTFDKCFLENVRVKYPNNNTEMQLSYLNASYLELNASDNKLGFKWKKSVPELKGSIIIVNMKCNTNSTVYSNQCFHGKVLGTWTSDLSVTNSSTTSTSASSPDSSSPTTKTLTVRTDNKTTPYSSSTNISSSDKPPSDDSNTTIIIVAVVVPVVLLIFLIALIWCLCKRSNRNSSGIVLNSTGFGRKKTGAKTVASSMKQFSRTESNLKGPDAYIERPQGDTTGTFKAELTPPHAQTNPGYATPEPKRIRAANGDLYAVPNKTEANQKKSNGLNYMDPSALVINDADKSETDGRPNQPTEYAAIVGVLNRREKTESSEK